MITILQNRVNVFTKRLGCLCLVLILTSGVIDNAHANTWEVVGSRAQDYDMGGEPNAEHGSENGAYIKSKVTTINGWGGLSKTIKARL